VEPFKISQKSICHKCLNLKESCSLVSKTSGTDSRIGYSFIMSCSKFNKPIEDRKNDSYILKVDNAADSRIEMMGGGYKEFNDGTAT
jgi:hypothetical protein